MKKSNLDQAVEMATVMSAAEICDRILRKTAGNDVSSVLQQENINQISSSLSYAGLAKTEAVVGGTQ